MCVCVRDGRQNANWAWAGRQKFRGGEASKIYKEKGKPIGTKLTAWLSKPLTASSFGSLSLLLAAIFPDNSFWCLLFVWTSFSPFHFFLLTSFSDDATFSWSGLPLTPLALHSPSCSQLWSSQLWSSRHDTLLSWQPFSLEPLSFVKGKCFYVKDFLLFLGTIPLDISFSCNHQEHGSSNPRSQIAMAQRSQQRKKTAPRSADSERNRAWAAPFALTRSPISTPRHTFVRKKTYGFVRFPTLSDPVDEAIPLRSAIAAWQITSKVTSRLFSLVYSLLFLYFPYNGV